jgi:3-hydroxyisobutyrate dehydrogenase-like beta-hydroxyacid dehydrogenase
MKQAVGFIGLGNMGGPMAGRLIDAGFEVHVHDIQENAREELASRGAEAHASPREVADRVSIIFLSLPTAAIVEQVIKGDDGLLAGSMVKTVVEFSTIGARAAAAFNKLLNDKGVNYVDSPVSGGIAGAAKGTLAVMVSCRKKIFDELTETLSNFGKTFYVGENPGQAQAVKLANNLLSMTAIAITSEAMVMGAKLGIAAATMLDIINAGSGRNTATTDKFPRSVLPGTFNFGFQTGLAHKDVKLCIDEANALGVPMIIGNAVCELYSVTNATQGPKSDFTSVCKVIESWAGAEVRSQAPTSK